MLIPASRRNPAASAALRHDSLHTLVLATPRPHPQASFSGSRVSHFQFVNASILDSRKCRFGLLQQSKNLQNCPENTCGQLTPVKLLSHVLPARETSSSSALPPRTPCEKSAPEIYVENRNPLHPAHFNSFLLFMVKPAPLPHEASAASRTRRRSADSLSTSFAPRRSNPPNPLT